MIKNIIPIGYSALQSDIDAGLFNTRTGGYIMVVDNNGADTGVRYEVGAAGVPPTVTVTQAGSAGGGSALVTNWTANTPLDAGAIVLATVAVGGFIVGEHISSNTSRTTGATFNATEAGNFTSVPEDTTILKTSDVINDLTTGGATKVASAETVKTLKTEQTSGTVNAAFKTIISEGAVLLASGTDLDTIVVNGTYNGINLVNAPTSNAAHWYYVEVIRHRQTTGIISSSWATQKATRLELTDGIVHHFMRVRQNGTWGAWVEMTTSADIVLKANIASPTFTGTPTAPTAAVATNTLQIATTAFVQAATAALVDASPATLDTLNELAAALGDDANFATTIATALGLKAPLASPAFTGTPTGITKAHVGLGSADNTADTAKPVSTAQQTALNLKADNTDLTDGSINAVFNTLNWNRAELLTGGNLDTLIQSGFYDGQNMTGAPTTGWFYIIHQQHSNAADTTWASQIAIGLGSGAGSVGGAMYTRARVSGVWAAWREVTRATTGGGTLAAGTVTITNAAATTTSRIMLTRTGAANAATLAVTTKSAGSFVVTSSSGADTGTFDFMIL